jgi:chemotaxis protein histidine kinase CheA
MSDDLKQYLFAELEDHIDKLDNHLQAESAYEVQEYHLDKIREITKKLKGAAA